jgi:hypothetical protein
MKRSPGHRNKSPRSVAFDWQPIATAPFDRDLELAVFDAAGEVHALAFPCHRRVLGGWLNPQTMQCIDVCPTHWREWQERR